MATAIEHITSTQIDRAYPSRHAGLALFAACLLATAGCSTAEAGLETRSTSSQWKTARSAGLAASLDLLALRLSAFPAAALHDVAVSDPRPSAGQDCGFATFASDALTGRLARFGRFRSVVERNHLGPLLTEQRLQAGTFLVDRSRRVTIGKLIGATAIVAGSFSEDHGGVIVNARLIDVETGKIIATADISASRDPRLAGLLCGGESAVDVVAPGDDQPSRRWLTGPTDMDGVVCDPGQPWVGFVDGRDIVSRLPRATYVDLGFAYGDDVWTEIVLDGRDLPLCGRKRTIDRDGRHIDLAPPHSRVFVVVEDSDAKLHLFRQCWVRNPVTDEMVRRGTGDHDHVQGGGGTGWAWSCSYGQ